MNLNAYRKAVRRMGVVFGLLMLCVGIPGTIAMTVVASKLADSSTWERSQVFLCMFPAIFLPLITVCFLVEIFDKFYGVRCACGQSLTIGRHVKALVSNGGTCPKCGAHAVDGHAGQVEHEGEQANGNSPT